MVERKSRRTKKALERLDDLIRQYEQQGLSRQEAEAKARAEMQDNNRADWRDG